MIRICHIEDLELKQKVLAALGQRRGMSPAMIPEWFELDDADFIDLLNDVQATEMTETDDVHDPRS